MKRYLPLSTGQASVRSDRAPCWSILQCFFGPGAALYGQLCSVEVLGRMNLQENVWKGCRVLPRLVVFTLVPTGVVVRRLEVKGVIAPDSSSFLGEVC